jgi:hypothetical protein
VHRPSRRPGRNRAGPESESSRRPRRRPLRVRRRFGGFCPDVGVSFGRVVLSAGVAG